MTEERYWALFYMPLCTFLHNFLNVLAQILIKMLLQRMLALLWPSPCIRRLLVDQIMSCFLRAKRNHKYSQRQSYITADVSQSVCLCFEPNLGLLIFFQSYCLVFFVVRPLWREVGVCNLSVFVNTVYSDQLVFTWIIYILFYTHFPITLFTLKYLHCVIHF
jgi:hypothetical protein